MPNWLLYPFSACVREPIEALIPLSPGSDIPAEFWPAQLVATAIVVVAAVFAISAVRLASNGGSRRPSLLCVFSVFVMITGFLAVQVYAGAASPLFPMYMSEYDVSYYFAHGEYMISMLAGLAILLVTVGLALFVPRCLPLLLIKGSAIAVWVILALGWIAITLAGKFCA